MEAGHGACAGRQRDWLSTALEVRRREGTVFPVGPGRVGLREGALLRQARSSAGAPALPPSAVPACLSPGQAKVSPADRAGGFSGRRCDQGHPSRRCSGWGVGGGVRVHGSPCRACSHPGHWPTLGSLMLQI